MPTPKEIRDALSAFADKGITVNVPKLNEQGEMQRNADTKRIITEDQDLAAEHIIGVRDLGDALSITTVDGKKYQADKADKAGKNGKAGQAGNNNGGGN